MSLPPNCLLNILTGIKNFGMHVYCGDAGMSYTCGGNFDL